MSAEPSGSNPRSRPDPEEAELSALGDGAIWSLAEMAGFRLDTLSGWPFSRGGLRVGPLSMGCLGLDPFSIGWLRLVPFSLGWCLRLGPHTEGDFSGAERPMDTDERGPSS